MGTNGLTIVRPVQFGTQCVTNWESEIEKPHIAQVGDVEALAELCRELGSEGFEQTCAVVGALAAALLLFDDFASDIPVRLHHATLTAERAARRASTSTARMHANVSEVVGIRSSLIVLVLAERRILYHPRERTPGRQRGYLLVWSLLIQRVLS